jgi:hypothetical protein
MARPPGGERRAGVIDRDAEIMTILADRQFSCSGNG